MPPQLSIENEIRGLDALTNSGDGRPAIPRKELVDATREFRGFLMRRLNTVHLAGSGKVTLRQLQAMVEFADNLMKHGDGHPSPISDLDLDVVARWRAEVLCRIDQAFENGDVISDLMGPGPRRAPPPPRPPEPAKAAAAPPPPPPPPPPAKGPDKPDEAPAPTEDELVAALNRAGVKPAAGGAPVDISREPPPAGIVSRNAPGEDERQAQAKRAAEASDVGLLGTLLGGKAMTRATMAIGDVIERAAAPKGERSA